MNNEESNMLEENKIVQSNMAKQCPFCFKKLGIVSQIELRTKKICKCSKCRKVIDRRYIIY